MAVINIKESTITSNQYYIIALNACNINTCVLMITHNAWIYIDKMIVKHQVLFLA